MDNNSNTDFIYKTEELDNNHMKEEWLKKELELKNTEIKNLNLKNKFYKIFGFLKLFITIIFIVLQVALVLFILNKYDIIDLENENEINSSTNLVVPIVDINQQLTMEYVNSLIKKMDKFKTNNSIKEVLIVMNCPGGSPVAADEFTFYIKDFNKTKKIHMYVQTMAASGGYYIASAIKPIVANPNAIVGSIGVIMPKYTIKKLADKIGVEEDNVVVGEYKVPATMFNNVSKEQKEYLQNNMLIPTYNNFINVVATNRSLDIKNLENFAQGKIFIANKPEIKDILVDEINNFVDFKNKIKENLVKEYNIDSKNIDFTIIEDKKEKFPNLNIKLDVSNLIENTNSILK